MPLPALENPGIGSSLDTIGSFAPGEIWSAGQVATTQWTSEQFLVHWDGSDWNELGTLELEPQRVEPFAPRHGAPDDVDGTGPDDIWIVGTATGWGDGRSTSIPLVVQWDGSRLIEHELPLLSTNRHRLFGVTAIAPDDVWAVGMHRNVQRNFVGIIYHWDGSDWTAVLNPAEAIVGAELNDVYALATDDIWTVGNVWGEPLIMHYDGVRWKLFEVPPTATTSLAKVVMVATDDVWATSYFEPGYFHWDGTSWSIVDPPVVPGATSVNRGGGMAVAGACDVWSAGSYTESGFAHTLTERLTGDVDVTGDANGDRQVDFADVLAILSAWGPCEGACPEDLDDNGIVEFADLLIVLANWT